jgi:ferredoxin
MIETAEISDKRRLFLELVLKLLSLKEKSTEIKPEILEKFGELMEHVIELKESIPEKKEKIKENIIGFLNNTDILNELSDLNLKKYLNNKIDVLSLNKNALDKKNKLKLRDKAEQFESKTKKFDLGLIKEELEQIFKLYKNFSALLYEFKEIEDIKPSNKIKFKDNLFSLLSRIDEFLEENEDSVHNFFDFFNNELLKVLKYRKLNFAFIQLKRAFNDKRLDYEKLINYIENILKVELSAAIILYLLRNDIPFNLNELKNMNTFTQKTVLNSIFLLMDRRLIETTEDQDGIKYKLIGEGNKLSKSLKNMQEELNDINNKIRDEKLANVINTLKEDYRKINTIGLVKNEEISRILNEITNKINSIKNKINVLDDDETENVPNLRILAGMELYRMKNIPLIFEKGQYLVEEEDIADLGKSEMAEYFENNISKEYNKALIVVALKNYGEMTPSEISKVIKISQNDVVDLLLTMIRDGQIEIIDEKDEYFLYDIPHKLNSSELILKSYIDSSSLIIENLDLINGIEELTSENFGILNIALIKVDQALEYISTIQDSAKNILMSDLKELKSRLKNLKHLSGSINRILEEQKLTIDINTLIPIRIPEREDEIAVDYDPYIVGFGEINWDTKKCLSCRSCVDICPEDALNLINKWDIESIFQASNEELADLPENKRLLYNLIKKLKIKNPDREIKLPKDYLGLGNIEILPIKCIACRKCDEKCPNEAITFTQVWDLPEVMSEFLKKISF